MLGWALTFLLIALSAALLGFGELATAAAGLAQLVFVLFFALFAMSLIVGLRRPQRPAA